MKKVLIFDFGNSSGRALLCSYENKSFISNEIHRFTNNTVIHDGKLCWNIEALFKEMEKSLDIAENFGFDAVSVDTWGVDFALLDSKGEFVQRPVSYHDNRTDGIPEEVYREIPKEELYMTSGVTQMQINTLYQLVAMQKSNKKALSGADHLLMMPDLINFFLTGKMVNEYTEATTTGLIDPKTKDWNWELISRLKFPKKLFGKIVMPGEIIGELKACYTSRTVPVYAAPSHDTASAVLAVPSEEKKFAYISCGSWALFGTELEEPIISKDTFESDITNEGGYGGTVTFLKNIKGTWFLQECRKYFNSLGEIFTFNDMEAFASSAPSGVAKINPNDPVFNADQNSRVINIPKKVAEYCERTGQNRPKSIAQTLRIIYESLADEFAKTLDNLEKITGNAYPTVYMVGGGSKDRLLCQLTANATGRIVIAGPSEATAIGNTMSTLIAMGEIKNVKEARAIVRRGTEVVEFLPDFGDGDGRR